MGGDFQIAPKDTGQQRSIISVGQVCDSGNIITFRSTGGTILDGFIGNRIGFLVELRADTSAKTKSGIGGVRVLMALSKTLRVPLKRNPRDREVCLYCPVKLKLNNTS